MPYQLGIILLLFVICKNLPTDSAVIPDHDPGRWYLSRLDETDVHPVERAAKINRYKYSFSVSVSCPCWLTDVCNIVGKNEISTTPSHLFISVIKIDPS